MTVAIEDATGVAAPRMRLGGRFRLGERVTAADGLSLWKASLWKATDELLRRNYSEADIHKILGGNALRALRKAGEVAAVLQKTTKPEIDPVKAERD